MKTIVTRHPSLVLAAVAMLCAAGCATVDRAREAQENDTERTVRWAETPFAGRTDPLPMEELADWARTNAPSVVQARLAVESAQIALRGIRSSFIPRVDGSIAYTYASLNVDPHNTEWDGEGTWGGGLSLNWLLYDFGRTSAATRQAVAALAAADLNARNAENEAVYAVRSACFDLNRTVELLRVAVEASDAYRQHRDQTLDRLEAGAAMNYDVSKAEVDYANALLAEIEAVNAVANARASLNLALGLAETPAYELGDCSFRSFTNDVDVLMETAATNAPALAALRASAEAAKNYVDWTICDLYPNLSLSLTFDAKGDSSPLLWNYAAVPQAAQTLFSAGTKNRQIEEAVVRLRTARSRLAEAEQKLYGQLFSATLAADRARRSLAVAERAESAARENFDVVSSRYDVGKASVLERTDAQVALTRAEAAVVAARYDWLDTQILIARLIGE